MTDSNEEITGQDIAGVLALGLVEEYERQCKATFSRVETMLFIDMLLAKKLNRDEDSPCGAMLDDLNDHLGKWGLPLCKLDGHMPLPSEGKMNFIGWG